MFPEWSSGTDGGVGVNPLRIEVGDEGESGKVLGLTDSTEILWPN